MEEAKTTARRDMEVVWDPASQVQWDHLRRVGYVAVRDASFSLAAAVAPAPPARRRGTLASPWA